MKINHNMSAVITNAQLLRNENSVAATMERLSSGIKINHAKDDPAGMAISNKMQAQIDGLGQASENASNGISVLQIADSAVGEMTNMLQRMRELAVQAATDTATMSDREAIQQEIDQLKSEVDRISRDTEYNTKKLLDGSSDTRVYSHSDTANPIDVSRMAISDAVKPGEYTLLIAAAAEQATELSRPTGTAVPEGKIIINGMEIGFDGTETADEFFEKLRDGAEKGNVNVMVSDGTRDLDQYPETGGYTPTNTAYTFGDQLAFVCNEYGADSEVKITCSTPEMEVFLGMPGTKTNGKNMEIAADLDSSFGAQSSVTVDGNRVTVTDVAGFSMDFMVGAGQTGELDLEVTEIGTMTLQIGANEHQTMEVRIPQISSETLYLDEVDVTKVGGGDIAISVLDDAIGTSSAIRSRIGAYQNRLEYAVGSLDESEEDMTQAISRIKDADMAEEMTEYTKNNVLVQAGTSVLAQANDLPQMVLQLLQ